MERSAFDFSVFGDEEEEIDIGFALHLGITTAVLEFRAETIAYRDGYERLGENGVYVDKEHFKKLGFSESFHTASSHRSQRLNLSKSQRVAERFSSMYLRTNHRMRYADVVAAYIAAMSTASENCLPGSHHVHMGL
ncbi:MAG: hypothetical protein HETSPECPRED_002123 [Heterodermia speciosa]|uniref:Uncharacterized protein n=1 Tax=Heterodermia speciosa TaxID=116794 RepID=A0A8H3J3R6_9LECA|nr:MAG: hypothetical protein HETSPECPRED_002123 [Heterodermia speciosa]